jgi:hypothetical protein
MNLLSNINGITILIAGVFLVPIIGGVLYPATADRIRHSFLSMLSSLELIAGILLTLYAYKLMFLDKNAGLLNYVYRLVPTAKDMMARHGNDFAYHAVFLFLFLFVIMLMIHVVLTPLYRLVLAPLANRAAAGISKLNSGAKRFIGGAWQLPRSLWLVLILTLGLNLFTSVSYSSSAADYINRSAAYTMISQSVLKPLMGT